MPAVILLLLFGLLAWTQPARAQTDDARPRVGLVLSGGGAKGFAHIGVLQILERAGITPDFITGTSMGSIVGGLYAMGYSADSLEAIALAQDWDRVLTDDIPLDEVLYEEKPYFKNQHIELPIDSTGLVSPGALIAGQEIEHLLHRLTLPAYRIQHFDSLPTPFRCMATDLYYGTPCEMDTGSLPRAIRASMAIPSIFSPVTLDSLILVDGGLIRNFPVAEARKMGADIIIGVHTGPRLTPRDQLAQVSAILGQTLFLGSLQDSEIQREDVDLYIEPDIAPFGTSSFSSAEEIIRRGEEAAMAMLDSLTALADSLDRFGPPPVQRPLPALDSVYIDEIRVFGNKQLTNEEILARAQLAPGQWVRPAKLDQAINHLFGTNYFTKITYELTLEENRTILTLRGDEKANILFKAALSYDSYHEAGIGLNVTLRNQFLPASRFMAIAKIATNHRYRLEFLKYLGRAQSRYVEARWQLNRDRFPLIQDGRTTSEFRLVDMPIDLGIYQRNGSNLLLGLGMRFERLTIVPTISESPLFSRLRYLNLSYVASVGFNDLDRNIMPTRGNFISLEGAWVTNLSYRLRDPAEGLEELPLEFHFDPYPRITFRSAHYIPTGTKGSIVAEPFAGLVLTSQATLSDFFLMGSPFSVSRRSMPLYGLEAHELGAQATVGASGGYQYFLFDNLLLAANLSAAFFGDPDILSEDVLQLEDFFLGAGLTAGYNSFFGPISLTLMMPLTDSSLYQTDFKAFLNFGYRF